MGMSRRTLLQAAAVGGALAALPMSSASAVVGVKPEVPYTGTNCFFKSNVTAAPIDSTLTAQQISWSNANQFRGYPILRGFSSTSWGTPLAEGRSTDPTWTLLGGRNVSPGFDGKFRAPQNLADYITGNTDSPLVVRDNVNRQSVVTAKVSPGSTDPVNHTITHNGGFIGRFMWDSNGLDYRRAESNSTTNGNSRGRIPDAYAINPDLFVWAIENNSSLDHVLHCFWEKTSTPAGHTLPMTGTESSKAGWGAEGWRLRLRPDFPQTGLTPGAQVLVRTLKTYGMYLGDNAGSGGTSLKLGMRPGFSWATYLSAASLASVKWSDWQVVQPGWVA